MLPQRLKPDHYKPKERLREMWASATRTCQQCGKVFGRADKPRMIYGAFMKLRFCSVACSHKGSRGDHLARFAQQIDTTGECWLWTGGLNSKGYGVHWQDGKHIKAHRYSYQLYFGPLGKLHALHSCDNPRCVNPRHLRAGTHQENMQDAKERARFNPRRGENGIGAKLTAAQVSLIRSSTERGADIARRMGVSKSTVYAIRNGQNWRSFA